MTPSILDTEVEILRMKREGQTEPKDITARLAPFLHQIAISQDARLAATFERPIRYTV